MRMWGKKRPFEPLGLYAYEEERGFGAFITDHAEDVYKKLTPEQQKAAERLFQTITEQGPEGRAVRRPLEIDGIAEKTGLDTKLLESAIRPFQAEGFVIVTPSPRAPSPLVDISHEAIARQWWRLGPGRSEQGRMVEGWITKEGRFRRWVRQIEDAAKAHEQSGKDNGFPLSRPAVERSRKRRFGDATVSCQSTPGCFYGQAAQGKTASGSCRGSFWSPRLPCSSSWPASLYSRRNKDRRRFRPNTWRRRPRSKPM